MTTLPRDEPTTLEFGNHGASRLSHQMFRYPAKFHPPVAAALIEAYTNPGDLVFDPFCGSGTTMIEAMVRGRKGFGSDIDPLAIAVSRAKMSVLDPDGLSRAIDALELKLDLIDRGRATYEELATHDISAADFDNAVADLWTPAIPRLDHWFRRYVTVDLAKIFSAIDGIEADPEVLHWLRIVAASVIRNASNADPVPVSGLEVTAHMRRLDEAGRVVDPIRLVRRALNKARTGHDQFASQVAKSAQARALLADAIDVDPGEAVDCIITSPPYQNAVDYYRRHQLEMYWLRLTETHSDRLALLPRYIGKHRVPASHPALQLEWEPSADARQWIERIEHEDVSRARDLRAYLGSMHKVFENWHRVLKPGGLAVCVVGRSNWRGAGIPTEQLFVEMAENRFSLEAHRAYQVRNRYMSYSRHNGADIAEEHVLVLRRRDVSR